MPDRSKRWHEAQRYERSYWEKRADQIKRGDTANLGWYEWRANRLARWLTSLDVKTVSSATNVLEIGNGPVGIISYFPGKRTIGLDPLEGFFKDNPELTEVRDPATHYLAGQGEYIPLRNGSCQLVIVDNCIDHVLRPERVVAEIRRVLHAEGVLYMSVNTRARIGYLVHRVMSRLAIDQGHPHSFTKGGFRSFINERGFELLDYRHTTYLEASRDEIADNVLKGTAKSLLGIAEMATEIVARLK